MVAFGARLMRGVGCGAVAIIDADVGDDASIGSSGQHGLSGIETTFGLAIQINVFSELQLRLI